MSETPQSEPRQVVRADAAARAQRAWELRIAGFGWDEIADETGFAHATNAARAAKRYAEALPSPDRADQRKLIRERAEWLWQQVRTDVEDRRPGATRAGVALLQRMAAFDGLDAPQQVLVTPTAPEYQRVLDALLAAHGEPVAEEGDPFAEEYLEAEVVQEEGDPLAPTRTPT